MADRKNILYSILKSLYGKTFCLINHVKFVNNTNSEIPSEGPLIIISNHVGTYDPIEIAALMKRPVHWVTGAYLFKMPFVGFLMKHVIDAIPKQQGRSDLATISCMQKHLKQGQVVGIFPEGTRTWDGDIVKVNYTAIAKMLKILKSPVVLMSIEGGFAREPRWVVSRRRGPITLDARYMLKLDEITETPVPELAQIIEKNFAFSNDEWKKSTDYKYSSTARAEGIQRLFYMCPKCKKIGTIEANGNKIKCTSCGVEANLTDMDDIASDSIEFTKLPQWHEWEKNAVYEVKSFPKEPGCLLQKADSLESETFETISREITVSMSDSSLCISYNSESLVFKMQDISSFILNTKQTMEFIVNNSIYRVRVMPTSSSLKYLEYYLAFKKENENV